MTALAPGSVLVSGLLRRKPLDEVVDELLVGVPADIPADHVCRQSRWRQCTHDHLPQRSLLDRLAELSIPAQELLPDPQDSGPAPKRGKAPAGSPAPWSAPAAELLDEILRGAVELQKRARGALGLEPFTVAVWSPTTGYEPAGYRHRPISTVAIAPAGRAALDGLPGVVVLLAERDHPLGVRISKSGRRSQGSIEDRVRSWHQRALTLTGHRLPLERLPDIPNPDHPWAVDVPRLVGPACDRVLCGHASCAAVRGARHGGRMGPVCRSCGHESCRRFRSARQKWIRWLCPACGADSLRRDPVNDEVTCLRSSCADAEDQRSSWPMSALQAGSADPWGDWT